MSNITQYTYKELFEIQYRHGSFDGSECYFGIIKFIPLNVELYNPPYGMYEMEDETVKSKLEELCDNYNIKFRTWMLENDFEFISPEDYEKVGCNYYHYWGEYGKGTEEFYKDHYKIVKKEVES